MNITGKYYIRVSAIILSIVSFFNADDFCAQVPPNSAFTLNRTHNFLPVGGNDSLFVTITADEYTDYNMNQLQLVWISSNPHAATIDTNGRVSAANTGTTVIHAWSVRYDTIAVTCTLSVFTPTIPIVYLEVDEAIVDEPKVSGWMKVYDRLGRVNYEGHIGIELRGSSTRGFPKQSYSVETRISADSEENRNVKLLGLPEENDWVFFASYSEKTLMRCVLVYSLMRKIGWYATRHRYCELYLNGEYRGVYILFEKIKRDRSRVNIYENENAESFDDMSFIIKRDKFDGASNNFFLSRYGVEVQYHYPKPDEITEKQKVFIQSYFAEFEDALFGNNFADENTGYRKYIDVDSWIDYMLVQFFTQEIDAFGYSSFMYRDVGGKIVRGPVWDYNWSLGNANYWIGMNTDGFYPGHWYRPMLKDGHFRDKMIARWFELREDIMQTDNILNFLDSTAAAIEAPRIRNFKRWPVLGVYIPANVVWPPTYEGELEYLYGFIRERLAWIDGNIEALYQPEEPVEPEEPEAVIESYDLMQNFPNPFNPITTIEYQIPEEADVVLEVYTIMGQRVRKLIEEWQSAGVHSVFWDGTNDAGIRMPTGVYFYRIRAGAYANTKKMILVK